MTVYVDNVCISWRGRHWCHLLADSLEELHQFAVELELSRSWFHKDASYPHYDITVEIRNRALCHGALLSDRATIIRAAKKLKSELSRQQQNGAADSQFVEFHRNLTHLAQ